APELLPLQQSVCEAARAGQQCRCQARAALPDTSRPLEGILLMSATASCCRQCGAPLLAAAGDRDRAALCFACGGTALALLPGTIDEAASPSLTVGALIKGPGRPATPLGLRTNPDGPRRLLRDIGTGSLPAFLLVFGTFMLFASPRPRSEAATPDTAVLVAFADLLQDQEMRTAAELDYGSDPDVLVALREETTPEEPGDTLHSVSF